MRTAARRRTELSPSWDGLQSTERWRSSVASVPIMGRVTINGTVAQFSCKQSISKELWDAKGNRAKGKSVEARETNLALDNIKAQIIKHYQRISDREAFVTAEMVRNAYQGIGGEYETLLKAFDRENEVFKKRVGKDRKLATYQSHATVVPIVTGERRKARKKQAEGKHTYHKKANAVRLCADDLMSRERLVAYHDSYAAAMAKYGLQRGIRGSEARHTTTAQYYRDLKRQTGELEANVQQLQTEQRQAERQLDEVRKEIKSEKLEAAKTEAKTALVARVGSLLGSGKLKSEREELQQRIFTLESQNEELIQHIKTMELEHRDERTKFNEYMDKIQRYFPYVDKLLPLIDFCRNTLRFSERVIQELCKLKKVRLKGDFYSPEFNRKFRDENAAFSFEEDKSRKGHYHICVNDIPLVQWFRQKANEWRNGLGIAPTKQDKGLKI